jgi:hypothetical protein
LGRPALGRQILASGPLPWSRSSPPLLASHPSLGLDAPVGNCAHCRYSVATAIRLVTNARLGAEDGLWLTC